MSMVLPLPFKKGLQQKGEDVKKKKTSKKAKSIKERVEEAKVPDPTTVDLRMTRTEWTVFWKIKYEASIVKIVRANEGIEYLKKALKAAELEIDNRNAIIKELSKKPKCKCKTKKKK